ncbi:amidase [Arthrobacter phage Mendel]|uniref:N-acetylmuramoyl-L-alanine amidase n=1 Tax=Arthrobacter phage Mendel TaxID=2484218 RepID=A0A3G3M107_9CAUD|nr:amidase [Arthrobacter phage Mendel]AYQ99936.1 lysin A, amidase domain [Arthrobacter phage Mendel]
MNIIETFTAKGYTPAAYVAGTFGQPRTLDGIVIHHWGAPGQTHDGVVNFFVNGPGTTSAHFVASAGKVHCLVSPDDAAWHSGNPIGNATTIGIECRPEATDADYHTVAELVAWLRDTYSAPLPLSAHREWQNTACPGVWDLARVDRLASTATPTTPATTLGDPLAKLTDKEQQELLAAVREIRANVKDINTDTGTGKLSLRQAIANIRKKVGAN